MRRRIFWASVAIAVFAVLFLLTQRKAKPAMPADDTKVSAVSATRVRNAVVDKQEAGRPVPAGLSAAYAPGVVVVTNGVLEPDPRYRFKFWPERSKPGEWDQYVREMRVESEQGADGKATFHVVDTDGNSVAGADISACFFGDREKRGVTDPDGLFVGGYRGQPLSLKKVL